MLKRKIYDDLLRFKKDRKEGLNKCLFLVGARQVGKTYIVREFAKKEYKSFIEINFIKDDEYKDIFSSNLDSKEIIKRITALIPNIKIIKGETLLFLDEIQACGQARTSLKFLASDFDIDVIASGSLLGLSYFDNKSEIQNPISIPVGYELSLTMYSLDFEEFLWANGYGQDQIKVLKEYYDNDILVPKQLHDTYEQLFKEFIVVGGMPEVVNDFIINKDFTRVATIQEKIINSYKDDISKYAKGVEKAKVRRCYDSIPIQLAKELKKFQYSKVEKGQTARKYSSSIQWLIDSNLVNIAYRVYEPNIPLLANSEQEYFKLYVNDTGLLLAMYGYETKKALLNDTLKGNAKGGIYENIISECLIKKGYKLYFYRPDDNNEIEFLIEKDGDVIPIEVKAKNSKSTSLNNYMNKFNPKVAYKLISTGQGKLNNIKIIPHYFILFI